jgi:hypothetical protein
VAGAAAALENPYGVGVFETMPELASSPRDILEGAKGARTHDF